MALRMSTLPHILQMIHHRNQGDSRDAMDVNEWLKIWAVLQFSMHSQLRFWELKSLERARNLKSEDLVLTPGMAKCWLFSLEQTISLLWNIVFCHVRRKYKCLPYPFHRVVVAISWNTLCEKKMCKPKAVTIFPWNTMCFKKRGTESERRTETIKRNG